MIRIRASGSAPNIGWRQVWTFRELLFSFFDHELTVRHKQTLLGPVWLVLQPLLQALVFAVFMHYLARVPSDGPPYALFAYAGLIPWLFFSNGVQSLSYGLMMNSHLVTRVYFPRVLIPLSMVLVRLVDFLAAILVFLPIAFLLGLEPHWSLLFLPVLMIQAAFLTLAVGSWTSCLTARFRDFGTLLPVALQAAMFASPVIYPASLLPPAWKFVYFLNPMAAIIEAFRACVFGRPFPTTIWVISVGVTLILAVVLLREFARLEERAVEAL